MAQRVVRAEHRSVLRSAFLRFGAYPSTYLLVSGVFHVTQLDYYSATVVLRTVGVDERHTHLHPTYASTTMLFPV